MTDRPGFAELFAALPVAVLVIDGEDRIQHGNGRNGRAMCESGVHTARDQVGRHEGPRRVVNHDHLGVAR